MARREVLRGCSPYQGDAARPMLTHQGANQELPVQFCGHGSRECRRTLAGALPADHLTTTAPGQQVLQGRRVAVVSVSQWLRQGARGAGTDGFNTRAFRLDPPHDEPLKRQPAPQELCDIWRRGCYLGMTTGFAPHVQDEFLVLFHDLFPSYSMAMALYITDSLSYFIESSEKKCFFVCKPLGNPALLPKSMRVAYRRWSYARA